MPPLPDVDSASYNEYQANEFGQQTERRIGALAFSTAADSRIASLNDMYAPPPQPQPAPVDQNLPEAQPAPVVPDVAPVAPYAGPISSPIVRPPAPAASPFTSPQAQSGGTDYVAAAMNAADKHGIDPQLFVSQIQQESGFDPTAGSPAGARGIAQIVPKFHPGVDTSDPIASLDYAANLMSEHLNRYGGDVTKALAAYNAGAGAVDKYGGVPPFEETQRYVDKILSRIQAESSTNPAGGAAPGPTEGLRRVGAGIGDQPVQDISQFGDPQLSADEAYAACGPAAAVRFAQRFGRNPTLKEALDLARSVGWTSQQGMAGLGSEKALMDKIGVPTKLVQPVDEQGRPVDVWSVFAKEAQTGNPVTISTTGHYFTADGYNPDTGAFHVGRSGMDLKGGREWMTPQQMTALMGSVQGGLLADNPQVAAPSTADQGTNPLDWLGRQKDALVSSITGVVSDAGQAARSAISDAGQGVTNAVSGVQSPDTGNPVLDALGTGASAAGTVASTVGQGIRNITPTSELARGATGMEQIVSENRALFDQQQRLVDEFAGAQQRGDNAAMDRIRGEMDTLQAQLPDARNRDVLHAAADRNPSTALIETGANLAGAAVAAPLVGGGAVGKAIASAVDPMTGLPAVAGRAIEAAGPAVRDFAASEEGALKLPSFGGGAAGPPQGVDWQAAMATPTNQKVAAMVTTAPKAVDEGTLWQRFVRATTNRFEASDRFQEDALRGAGLDLTNPPEAVDLTARIRMLAGDPAAEIRIQNELKPAVQAMGTDKAAQQTLSAYLIHQNNVDVATALNNPTRKFSGGLTAADSQKALQDMQQTLGPDGWQHVEGVANQVYDFAKSLRQRMADSGLISSTTAQQWEQQYPYWVPTRILDYLDEAGGPKVGSKISLADNGVKQYTAEGTDKFREDPLGSLIGLAHQVESKARRNEAANALVELDNLSQPANRVLIKTPRPATANEPIIQRINNGVVERYIAPPELAAVINGPQITQAPGFVRNWTSFVRNVTTVLSPAFALVRNPSLDVPEYMAREFTRAGGNPFALPRITAELFRGYADAAQGLLQNEVRGAGAQQFLLGGGGQSGEVARTVAQRQAAVQGLSRSTPFEISSAQDVARILKDVVTLRPVAAVAERTELGPRIASMRLAEQRGATNARAVLAGRRVTLDFNEGGTWAKTVNQFVPFFNSGVQGSAAVVRMAHENPTGFAATMAAMVGLPAVLAEAWNHSDAQRAQDYNDVPDYLKSQGVVIMHPGEAPVDKDGNRKPQFSWINMRGFAPFAVLAREAAAHGLQTVGNQEVQPQDWAAFGGSLLGGASPIRANTIGDVPGSFTPQFFPGATTGLQLAMNKDFFRGSDIVSKRADENAPQAAREIADALTYVARLQDPSHVIHPSQVDFAVRDMLGGVGASAMGARGLLPGAEPPKDATPQNAPVVGGLVKALGVRGDTGQIERDASAVPLTSSARRYLQDKGIEYAPSPVAGNIGKVPLLRNEQARYQQLANRYVDEALQDMRRTDDLAGENHDSALAIVQKRIAAAHRQAAGEILDSIPDAEVNRRIDAAVQKKELAVVP